MRTEVLYPNVTSIPGGSQISPPNEQINNKQGNEFHKIFEKTLDHTTGDSIDLNQIKSPLKFSAHAYQRIMDRHIQLDSPLMTKINEAVDKALQKGLEDTLVLTNDAAFIVNTKNRTVVTALDRNSLSGNVFTNIDGAVIV
ncbi:MAG: flagellar protein [Deltaproteobacteria bacterium]|nr:flagellar protein [Deltaproteobacteria bacterium]MBI4924442.1 flagellar protein [Bdellovibrio sp.]